VIIETIGCVSQHIEDYVCVFRFVPKKAFIANRVNGVKLSSTAESLSGSTIKREPSVTVNLSTGNIANNEEFARDSAALSVKVRAGCQVLETIR
jgi:hypothetical protein